MFFQVVPEPFLFHPKENLSTRRGDFTDKEKLQAGLQKQKHRGWPGTSARVPKKAKLHSCLGCCELQTSEMHRKFNGRNAHMSWNLSAKYSLESTVGHVEKKEKLYNAFMLQLVH